MPNEASAEWLADIKKSRIMVCSECGHIMSTVPEGVMFDVFDCSWECPNCGTLFFSSDRWFRVGKLLLCEKRSA